MTAAREQGDEGRFERGIGEIRRRHVTADMVDAQKRHPQRKGERLGKGQPHEKRTHQSRSVGDRDRVHFAERYARVFHRAAHDFVDRLGMRAGGDLGHDAAVFRLYGSGRDDLVGQKRASADDRRRRFVARTFDAEYERRVFQRNARGFFRIRHADLRPCGHAKCGVRRIYFCSAFPPVRRNTTVLSLFSSLKSASNCA